VSEKRLVFLWRHRDMKTQLNGAQCDSIIAMPEPGSRLHASAARLIKPMLPHRYRYMARAAWADVMAPFFAGNAVECPLCGKTSRRWVSLGFPNRLCPHCFAFERHRLLGLYMRDEFDITTKPLQVLHFAAEYCFIRRFRHMSNLTYIVADLDPPRGAVRMDITDIPLESESVDLVICSHVLEHVQEDAKAMRELRRVVRPGGTALIMCPVDYDLQQTYEDPSIVSPDARREAFNQSDHVRIYGADFDERLRAAGFQVDANHYAQTLGHQAIMRYGFNREDIIYACT